MDKKVCVVTGGGGVLCSAFALEMARAGYAVAVLDINSEAAEKTASVINSDGYTAKAYAADCLDKKSIEAVHEKILSDMGSCDVLINGAGGTFGSSQIFDGQRSGVFCDGYGNTG